MHPESPIHNCCVVALQRHNTGRCGVERGAARGRGGRGGRKAAEGVGGKRPGGIPSEQEFDPPAAEAMKKIFSAKIQDPLPSIQVATDRVRISPSLPISSPLDSSSHPAMDNMGRRYTSCLPTPRASNHYVDCMLSFPDRRINQGSPLYL